MSLNINKVWLKKDGTEIMVPAKDIKKGDIVVARMGEVVPFDGEDLSQIVTLIKISKGLMKKIHRNYRSIVGINTALIILGVCGLIQLATQILNNMPECVDSIPVYFFALFSGKEGLFSAIVEPAANHIINMFLET